jgi:hypothetical protein
MQGRSQRVVEQVGVPLPCFTQEIERTAEDGFDIPQRTWAGTLRYTTILEQR